jgi:uncharacterized protein DUF3455
MRTNPAYLFVFGGFLAFAQSDTRAPENQRPVLTANAKGVQIYSCQSVSGTPQWVFQAPEATLFDRGGAEIGSHGAGPVWRMKDGSSVKGQVVAKSDAPGTGDIPWLLLKAMEGSGTLHDVAFIRRSETRGGVAPAGGCDVGRTERVPYSATYTFYAGKR